MTLTEGALQITFNNAINGRKFDDQQQHRLSHCMKAVDFVVELPDGRDRATVRTDHCSSGRAPYEWARHDTVEPENT